MVRVLVVDDETEVAKALRRLLRRNGFEVEIASSGKEALTRLEAFPADAVLSDERMPEMSGTALLVEVRRRRPETRCFLISGHIDLAMEACPEGVDGLFGKPWDERALLAALAGKAQA